MNLLVADIGGTNARFGFQKNVNSKIECIKFLKTRVDLDLASFKDDIWSH